VAIVLARSIALEATARMEAAREGERLRTALIDSLTHELRTRLRRSARLPQRCSRPKGWTKQGGWIWRPLSMKRPRDSIS